MAQVDYFLKIDGVQGESRDSKHKDDIEVLSWSWGETNSGSGTSGSGRGAGKVQMQDFNFVMEYNKASPKLFLACADGTHYPKVELFCRRAGGKQEEYLTVEFKKVLVSSYQTGGSSGDVVPVDQISLNFEEIKWTYKVQDSKTGATSGSVDAGWKVDENLKA